jgi:hypothetical protein
MHHVRSSKIAELCGTLALDALVPGVAAPAKLNSKDLLVVAHPRTMEVGILTVG